MVSGCSGIINDRVYAVTPSNNSYTLDSTFLNGTTLTSTTNCPFISSFIYSTCTFINNSPTIVLIGTDTHGIAVARLLQLSSSGLCQLSEKWYSITGMIQPVSVVPASCDSETSIPCFAVLGTSSATHQYIIQYPTSLSFNGANPISVGLGDSTLHPVLALPPNDISKLYVLGYPAKNQILVLPNSNNQTNGVSSLTTPTLLSTATNIPSTPTLIQPGILRRAEPTPGVGSSIKLDAAIENTGPATTVGTNIIIVSSSSLSVEVIPALSSGTLPITKFNLPPSSQIQNANSLKGIDSLTPLPVQQGDVSTIWINYDDGVGNHVQASSQQPVLFTTTSTSTGTPPGGEATHSVASDSAPPSLSGGAIAGIVIGSIAGFLFLVLLCFYLWRKQQRQTNRRQQLAGGGNINTRDLSLTDQRFLTTEKTASTPTTYVSTPNKDDSVSIISPPPPIVHPHHDNDDAMPPLKSLTRQINHQTHMDDHHYGPTSTKRTLVLEPYIYDLHNDSPPSYAVFPQGYATRSATRTPINNNNSLQPATDCTIHYFPASAAIYFRHLLHTNAGLQQDTMMDDNATTTTTTMMPAGLHTYDAISLSQPTHHGQYQFIWITTPFHPHHTLQALLFEGDNNNSVVDCTQFSFKAWSTLSMLKSLEALHRSGWIHRKLNPASFFYDQASSVTDWRLGGFYQSIWYTGLAADNNNNAAVVWDEWSAPECLLNNSMMMVSFASMDIWSLGCLLYSVATGKRVFQDLNEYHTLLGSGQLQTKVDAMVDEAAMVDDAYKELLPRMLQINPGARDSLLNLISLWIQENQLDDDE